MKIKQALKKICSLKKNSDTYNTPEITFDLQGDHAESLYSSQLLAQRDASFLQLFEAIVKKIGDGFGGWALTKSSLRLLFANIDQSQLMKKYCVVELGGGQSTLFWKEMSDVFPGLTVTTWEHSQQFIDTLNSKVAGSSIRMEHRKLQQYSDMEWEKIFSCRELKDIENALATSSPSDLPISEYNNTRAHNVFYSIDDIHIPTENIDILVVDGPHGNGRSLAFAVFAKYFRQGTIILIDDVSHYPFLEMLSKFTTFRVLNTSFSLNKQWIIVEIASLIK